MPIYEYQCTVCGERSERMQRWDEPPPACPACGGVVKKLASAPAVQFKGSGWYVTDYGGRGKQTGGEGAGGSEGKDAKGAKEGKDAQEGKAAAKEDKPAPAAKSETKSSESKSSESKSSGGGGSKSSE